MTEANGLGDWILLEKKDSSLVYSIDKKSETLLAFQKSPLEKKKKYDSKISKELEVAKKRVLELAGIKDWKITHRQNSSHRMEWIGSYTNGNHEHIYFFEVHYISKDQVEVQYLLTSRQPLSGLLLVQVRDQEREIEK